MTYLTVPISAEDLHQFEDQLRKAVSQGAEAVEIRTDYLENLTPEIVGSMLEQVKDNHLPVVVTCRDVNEGGAREIPLDSRLEILTRAARAGADFIDCEFANYKHPHIQKVVDQAIAASPNTRLILSSHDFTGPFEDISILYETIVTLNPEAIAKLVYKGKHLNDCFEAFDLLHAKDRDAVVLCMGPAGMVSRILAKKFGSLLTFASLDEASATAPGQVTIGQMKGLYRWDAIDNSTKVFGLIGNPVGHSMSPAIFNACFDEQGLNALYLPFLIDGGGEEFTAFLQNLSERNWLDFKGFSVTIPHKTNALDYANHKGDFVDNLAESIGAVNTMKIGFNGIVSCYNTDYQGAMDALVETMGIRKHQLHSVKVAVIGAGGVSRAVVAGLADMGAHVTIYNRTVSKAQVLAEEYGCKALELKELEAVDADVIINCTSIGMHPDTDCSPLVDEMIKPAMTVFDTVYNPLKTKLLRQAEAAGAKTVNGAEMFIRQAVAQYKHFLNVEPNEQTMRKVVLDRLGR